MQRIFCFATAMAALSSATAGCSDKGPSGTPAEMALDASTIETSVPADPAWACLGHPSLRVGQPEQPVTYVLPVIDFDAQPTNPQPVPGLNIFLCATTPCPGPSPSPPGVTIVNPDSNAPYLYAIVVPYGFANARLRLRAPGYVPVEYDLGGPLVGPPEGGYMVKGLPISMIRLETMSALFQDIGLEESPSPDKGILAVRTLNCLRTDTSPPTGVRAAGVRLQMLDALSPSALPWTLFINNIATRTTTTDARGVMGLANVEPAAYTLQGIAPFGGPDGTPYGTTAVRIEPGTITVVEIRDGIGKWGQ